MIFLTIISCKFPVTSLRVIFNSFARRPLYYLQEMPTNLLLSWSFDIYLFDSNFTRSVHFSFLKVKNYFPRMLWFYGFGCNIESLIRHTKIKHSKCLGVYWHNLVLLVDTITADWSVLISCEIIVFPTGKLHFFEGFYIEGKCFRRRASGHLFLSFIFGRSPFLNSTSTGASVLRAVYYAMTLWM